MPVQAHGEIVSHPLGRRTRLPLRGLSFVSLLSLLFLTGCSTSGTTTSRARASATAPADRPSAVLTPLASAPQNCPLKAPPQTMTLAHLGANSNVLLVGGGAFWIYGSYFPKNLHLSLSSSLEWPGAKMVAEVGPNYTQPVTVRMRELQTGALAWWTDSATPPGAYTQTLILDPQSDEESVGIVPGLPYVPHGTPGAGWKEWGIFPLFAQAGCYALEASWSGGSWQSVLTIGG